MTAFGSVGDGWQKAAVTLRGPAVGPGATGVLAWARRWGAVTRRNAVRPMNMGGRGTREEAIKVELAVGGEGACNRME